MPGPGKSFETFQADLATRKGFATDQVKGQADAANAGAPGLGRGGPAPGMFHPGGAPRAMPAAVHAAPARACAKHC
ncbi:MAG: hypothetical protein JO264_16045 [Acidisphaera sp.]|nr:hypothetical protein [Acidisphaera sp.]